MGKQWQGFYIHRDGCLVSPEGDFIYPGEVRGLRYAYDAMNADRLRVLSALDNPLGFNKKPNDLKIPDNLLFFHKERQRLLRGKNEDIDNRDCIDSASRNH